MLTAARLVNFVRAYHDDGIIVMGWLTVHEPLGACCIFAANDADRMKFGHFLGATHQFGDAAKRFTAKIHIKPGADHAQPTIRQRADHIDNRPVEKLDFIDSDDGCAGFDQTGDFIWHTDRLRGKRLTCMTVHGFFAVAIINFGLKNLNLLLGDNGAAHTTDQLFGFSAKHTSADDFDAPTAMNHELVTSLVNKKAGMTEVTPA